MTWPAPRGWERLVWPDDERPIGYRYYGRDVVAVSWTMHLTNALHDAGHAVTVARKQQARRQAEQEGS